MMSVYISTVLLLLIACSSGRDFDKPEELLDICLLGRHHKTEPGPEDELFGQCYPWKNHSCCTQNVTEEFHTSPDWYGFNWHHCGVPLSTKCQEHFMQDLCFYECSPNVGPWFVNVDMNIRDEKFHDVPMCRSECDRWWNDCKYDWTCLENWGADFDWQDGTNKCPEDKPCRKFHEIYDDAEEFCEKVWDYSFEVVDDDEPCMKIWFEGENPNRAVAEWKVDQMGGAETQMPTAVTVLLMLLMSFLLQSTEIA